MYRECFDAIDGSSAGAINATYFLSGQREGVSIYYEDIANKTFMDLGRLLDKNKDQGQHCTSHNLAVRFMHTLCQHICCSSRTCCTTQRVCAVHNI